MSIVKKFLKAADISGPYVLCALDNGKKMLVIGEARKGNVSEDSYTVEQKPTNFYIHGTAMGCFYGIVPTQQVSMNTLYMHYYSDLTAEQADYWQQAMIDATLAYEAEREEALKHGPKLENHVDRTEA